MDPDSQFDPNQQMVYVTADGSSYILPSQAFATNATDAGGEELVTYIYSGEGMAAGEGQAGDGNIQYLLVSADEAGGGAQQYVVVPQGVDASSGAVAGSGATVLTLGSSLAPATATTVLSNPPPMKEIEKPAAKPSTAGKKAEVIKLDLGKKTSAQGASTLITSAGSSGTAATKGATTAEVKVKGGTARVTILPSTKSPSKATSDSSTPGVTTIPIKFVSKSDSEVTTQTITVPMKASPKVSVSVKTVSSSMPAAVVSLPKVNVTTAPSTSAATPGSPSKKVGRPRKEEESEPKDALHQIVKGSGVISKSKQSPNVIVVPIQISKEMIAAKHSESAAKMPGKVNVGQSPTSSDSETRETKGKGKAVKIADETKEMSTAAKGSAKKLPAKPEPKTPAKAEEAAGLAPRRSNRASNISMKLAEWGLLPTSGSKHATGDEDSDDDIEDEDEEEDEEDEESDEELRVKLPEKRKAKDKDVEDDDDMPLIKTYVKGTKAGSPSKSTSSASVESSKEPGSTPAATPTAVSSKPAAVASSAAASTATPKVITVSAVSTSKATVASTPSSAAKTVSTSTTPATATIKVVPAGGGTPATATVKVTGVSTPSGSIKVATVNVQPKKVVTIAKETGSQSQTPIVIKPHMSSTPSVKTNTPSSGIVKKSSSSSSTAPKLLQNKSLMCKPIMMTKATSCNPIRITKATQTDDDIDVGITVTSGGAPGSASKSIVPLPVPVFVPAPMAMFSTPTPVPMPLPLPIPVPCFIPTTRNSIQAIMKQLQELHDSLPSDPLEADMLKMAEAVAEASEEPGYILGSEIRPTVNGSGDGTHDESGESGDMSVDVLEMALRMASETGEEHVKAESEPKPKILEATKTLESSRPPAKRPRLTEVVPQEDDTDSQQEILDEAMQAASTSPIMVSSEPLRGPTPAPVLHAPISDAHMHLKYSYGINAWKQWVAIKNAEIEAAAATLPTQTTVGRRPPVPKLFKTEILQCSPDELSVALSFFVRELRKPTGEKYQPDSIYYLCLGIQHYLFENGRIDNIFADFYYERFVDALHEVLAMYEVRLNTQGIIVCRVSEEHLWEARQLGAHSPRVLLKTLVYFNTKYFMLQNAESHLALSFSNILKQWKKNSSTADGKPIRSVYLRYNTTGFPQNQQGLSGAGGLDNALHKRRTFDPTPYEQLENIDNPLRCPVKLYEFYLSKCPESIRNRNDVFYLTPEPSCVPSSPVWYSAQPLSTEAMNKLLGRIRVVREIQESQLNQAPAATLATTAGTTMTIFG